MENLYHEALLGLRKYWPYIFAVGMLIGACVAHIEGLYKDEFVYKVTCLLINQVTFSLLIV